MKTREIYGRRLAPYIPRGFMSDRRKSDYLVYKIRVLKTYRLPLQPSPTPLSPNDKYVLFTLPIHGDRTPKKRFTIVDFRFVTDFNLSVCRSPARRVIKQRAPDTRKSNNSWELTNKSSTKQRRTKFKAVRKPQCSHFLLDVTVET